MKMVAQPLYSLVPEDFEKIKYKLTGFDFGKSKLIEMSLEVEGARKEVRALEKGEEKKL